MSYARGLGQDIIPLATVGVDRTRRPSGSSVSVDARWAQRAVNAGMRYNNSDAPLIAVDGMAGNATLTGLRTLSHQFANDAPVTKDPATSTASWTSRVIIPAALETRL